MGRTTNGRPKKDRPTEDEEMGFGAWGGYMAAKRAKLLDQFHHAEIEKVSDIFKSVAIHVNGLTKPPADTLKNLMAAHGGEFHMYQVSGTTHIIASNLPNVKIKHLGSVPIVKPSWITDSIELGKLLDYRRYLLYTNQSVTQPRIDFPVIEKASSNKPVASSVAETNDLSKIVEKSLIILEKDVKKGVFDQIRRGPTKTAADPKFLEEFYNNSRLHLISTLGAEFKQLIVQMREKSDGKFPGREDLICLKGKTTSNVLSGSVIMHIDMDCFFVSVGLRNHPELRGKPVAITHARNGQLMMNNAHRKASREQEFEMYKDRLPHGVISRVDKLDVNSSLSEIASCSYEARKCGVKNGMFLGQAIKLCPELRTLPYDFEGYREVSNTLYKTIASYTLDIEAVSCDEVYVDVTNILKETGLTVDEWATHIRNEIMNVTRCPCSAGFGANRLQARLATRKAKPSGQYHLQADDVEMYMSDIPLADLPGVGYATLAKLGNLGLNTCGDVQVTSLKVLQGMDKRPLNFHHERKSVSAEVNYGIRFKTVGECYNFLQSLSTEVYGRLDDIGMRARCLTLKLSVRAADAPVETAKFLGCGICDSLTKSVSNILVNSAEVVFREVKILYDKLNPPFVDLRGVGIQLTKLEKNAPLNKALTKFLNQPTKKVETITGVSNKPSIEASSEKNCTENNVKISAKTKDVVKSKRGRPKGIRSSAGRVQKNGTNMSLNKYFGQNKNVPRSEKIPSQKAAPLNEEIDLSVLNELPEDLRNEIIKEYQLEDKIQVSVPSTSSDVKNTEQASKYPENLNLKNESETNKWIQSSERPSEFDVNMIAEHFKQLAIDREIDVLKVIFNFLHRTFSDLNCHWHNAYYSMVNVVQQGMVMRYGGTLMVDRKFGCCGM
ncbi:hypothetical protein NQ317_000554 [Molorchus minor]|uniref:DNA repair protein REV1 n=1 Tax=Molorchus minor TaxID=1323400 RepID=A0ABQ9JRF8_9CUCU|nr:hypothetical protein NQ317_000554 [Molorchus minor]